MAMLRTVTLAVALIAAVLLGGVAMAAAGEGGGGLHAGQIVAIVIGIAAAAILLGLSAAYILPKPPKF
ncbi:MAG: hypothetical protein OXI41_02775 [Chloroflexota bacterium]|nr:hypothetical protein [Chloroflexota bacterium]MDE2896076.1 hypothetical protein [Chloroflexota bacterium]